LVGYNTSKRFTEVSNEMLLAEQGLIARAGARLRGRTLDQKLIEGADPAASPQLAARAAQLTKRSTRDLIADGLDRLAAGPNLRTSRWRVLPSETAIEANAPELHSLATLMRGPAPVYARGVAMLRGLLTDGTGPAYTDREGVALARGLLAARDAVAGSVPHRQLGSGSKVAVT
jgi:hypothetical protein